MLIPICVGCFTIPDVQYNCGTTCENGVNVDVEPGTTYDVVFMSGVYSLWSLDTANDGLSWRAKVSEVHNGIHQTFSYVFFLFCYYIHR